MLPWRLISQNDYATMKQVNMLVEVLIVQQTFIIGE